MAWRLNESDLSPDIFAAVMATGILSTAARQHHYVRISGALALLAALALISLVALVVVSAAKRRALPWDLRDPEATLPLFTFVAGCAVLGNRLSSVNTWLLPALGAVAAGAWLALASTSVRDLSRRCWLTLRDQAHGAWLLFSVATSGLAILGGKLAADTSRRQWLVAAVVLWVVALVIYAVMTTLTVWRAVTERLDPDGFEPDTWILMGALAIAVVAGHVLHEQAKPALAGGVFAVMVVAWAAASLWIPPLIYFSLHGVEQRPRLLRLTGAWWTLVFPLGMYSAATNVMAAEIHARSLQTVALAVFWDALLAWTIVVVAGLLRIPRLGGARQ